jgi:hypothetical protein
VWAWGMGDNSIFSVFSNIWSSVRLKIHLNSKLLGDKDCLHWIWPVKKKMTPFPFTFPWLCSLYFYILLLLMPVSGNVLLFIICRCLQNIIEISLSRKKCSSKYVVKNARNVTQFVWQPFSIEFQGFVK